MLHNYIMKLTIIVSLMLAVAVNVSAQSLTTTTSGESPRKVTVTAITDNIIRVSNNPNGVATPPSRTLLNLAPSAKVNTIDAPGVEIMTTESGVTVTLNQQSGAVAITADNRTISDNGVRTNANGRMSMTLSTPGNESFYGAGERGFNFNLQGDTLVMFNRQNYGYTAGDPRIRQMNITMPILISSLGYAIIFDDYAAAELITNHPLEYITESRFPVDYYFVNGVKGDDNHARLNNLVSQISSLTGRQDLPPLWSLGYITSKYGYRTQAETLGCVDTLKTAGYPLDGIVLDLYWYGKEQDMGRLDWEPSQWPNHKAMLKKLKKQGVNLVAISQPYVLRDGKAIDNYNELAPRGLFVRDSLGNPGEVTIWVGSGGMWDMSNPDTRNWLRNRYRKLTDDGITGWWGDLGEPEVHPDTLVHYNGLGAREYHNIYGNDWSQIIYDLFRDEYPDTRLMTLMRGGTVGLQRYSVFPWSTDVSRSWGGLQPQVIIMLNSGLSGMGYMSHDVGGFAIDPENPIDPELYVRWLQLGLFTPVFRTHSQQFAEPYHYPAQQAIILPIVKERYAWLPYNYTLAYENASDGQPLVRPLNFYDEGSNTFDDITDKYLWGRDILVAPVLTQGTVERQIVFPTGTWVDPTAPEKVYQRGDTITYAAPLDVLPTFVRAGSFIPRADYAMDNTGDYRTDRYTVRYYPVAGLSDGKIYEDDLTTPTTLNNGDYSIISFNGNATDSELTIDIATRNGNDTYVNPSPVKDLTFEIFNVDKKPRAVTVDGRKAKSHYDNESKTLKVTLKYNVNATTHIAVER